ncbi:exported hypothetical protein [Candidatus Sulfobium mesophilum]|uniref:Lipoprotein n=1 Tax=Candidatus Sulfobium mesophilum TaxID=2016548 RepID=A0A2U3QE37_9BACT|nr:exported hypothetical protein [Candidatus Sulfobium mesophilum]
MRKKVFIFAVIMLFVVSGIATAGSLKIGNHYNLNIIGFAKCTQTTTDGTYPDCFNGNAGDIQTSGHTIFVPLKTAQEWDVCGTGPGGGAVVGDPVTVAWLQKGVRILVSDNCPNPIPAGTDCPNDITVIDRDATDGTAKLLLPDGCYNIYARALGKPGGCMDIDTIICFDLVNDVLTQVDCRANLTNDQFVLVGHLDVDRIKGIKPSWTNATSDLLPVETGVGNGDPGYFDFFWQIFNQNLRLLQLRIDQVDCPQ